MSKQLETLTEMLKDRGHEELDIEHTSEAIIVRSETIFCIITKDDKINVAFLRKTFEDNEEYDHFIIVYPTTITPSAKSAINPNKRVEFYTYPELSFNITKHFLVPKHCIETGDIKYKHTEIPVILSIDPIVKWYDFPMGSVIKVIRRDESVAYRYVKYSENIK